MKTIKKIVAIMAAVLLLCSILPLSVLAADETITITGATGTLASDSLSISWVGTDYQVVNYKNTSSTAIRTSDTAHFRSYVGNQFTVSGIDGALMSQVVINCVSSYLINNTANTVSDGWTVSASGTAITYTPDAGSASELVITIGKQSRVTSVVVTPYVALSADCDHDSLVCGDTCPECETYVKEHKFSNNCVAECENGCGTANPDYADHVYSGDYDTSCNVCTAAREITFPEADSELTVAEIDTIAGGMDSGATTSSKYYVIGEVESIANTTYGNMTIVDENGDDLYIYGTYDADGTNRFDAMADQPEVGQTVKLYGVIGNYNGTNQMKNAWIIEVTGGCEHEYEYECSTNCSICGEGVRDVVCVTDAEFACVDGLCIYCGNDVDAVDHAFDSDYDADCNYGCGYTREVEEAPSEATIDFSTTTQRTEQDGDHQVWVESALVFTNNQGSSTSAVTDYYNPVRLYKSSEVIVAFPNMASIEFTCSSASYATVLQTSIGDAATVNGSVVTVTFDEPVNSYSFSLTAGQVRMSSVTVYASNEQEGCDHDALVCGETCANCGNYTKEHVYSNNCVAECENGCGTANPNYAEHVYSGDYDTTCNTCGGSREVAFPEADSTLTIAEAITIGQGMDHNVYTANKYYVTGIVTEVYNTTYGNMYIKDDAGNTLTIYGTDYAELEVKPGTGDTVTIYGSVGQYGSTSQIKNGNITEVVAHTCVSDAEYECTDGTCTICGAAVVGSGHEYDNACDVDCNLCYETREVSHNIVAVEAKDATCAENGNLAYWYCDVCGFAWLDAECTMNTNLKAVVLPATGEHTYDDEYDADCNVCGEVREVPEKPVEIIYGDADGDGEITLLDANLLNQYLSDWEVTLDEAAADADGDGEITLLDANLLNQFLSDWDVTLGPSNNQFNDGELTTW